MYQVSWIWTSIAVTAGASNSRTLCFSGWFGGARRCGCNYQCVPRGGKFSLATVGLNSGIQRTTWHLIRFNHQLLWVNMVWSKGMSTIEVGFLQIFPAKCGNDMRFGRQPKWKTQQHVYHLFKAWKCQDVLDLLDDLCKKTRVLISSQSPCVGWNKMVPPEFTAVWGHHFASTRLHILWMIPRFIISISP